MVSGGLRTVLPDDGSWTSKVWDIRNELLSFTNPDDVEKAVLLSNIESGVIVTIAKCISGRIGDYIAAWIYVPADAEVTGKQIEEVVVATRKELNAIRLDEEKLRSLFDTCYPLCDAAKPPVVNAGERCAYRKYGKGTRYELYEILDNPTQSYYSEYKGVFLIDSDSVIAGSGADLSGEPLRQLIKVSSVPDIHEFKAYMGETPMDKPIFLTDGDRVTITWKRQGYKDIIKDWTVKNDEQVPGISEPDFVVLVKVSPERFVVKDKRKRTPIERYEVRINEFIVDKDTQLSIPEAIICSCPVSVRSSDYLDYKGSIDLRITGNFPIELERNLSKYDFKIPSQYDYNQYATLHVESEKTLDGKSPIDGYDINPKGIRELKRSPSRLGKRQKMWVGIFILLALGIGFVAGLYIPSLIHKNGNQSIVMPTDDDKTPTQESIYSNTSSNE